VAVTDTDARPTSTSTGAPARAAILFGRRNDTSCATREGETFSDKPTPAQVHKAMLAMFIFWYFKTVLSRFR
jgi:hypothetical protein